MLAQFIGSLELCSSGALNHVLQALIFEVLLFLSVPLLGILIDTVIVGFVRKIIAKIITRKGEFYFSNYFLFPGVMIHELSHAFFALISGAKITEIALFKPEGGSLGHVSFQARGNAFFKAFQNSFSACAPVVVGLLLCSVALRKIFPVLGAVWQWVLTIYLFVAVLFHMNMSSADLKCYFRGALPILALALPFSLLYFFLF